MRYYTYIRTKEIVYLYQIIEGTKTFIQEFRGKHAYQEMVEYIESDNELAVLIVRD